MDCVLFLQQDYVILFCLFVCFFDICVYCGHRKESPDLVCVSCDKSTKMDGTDHSEELYLQRLNALCRLCGRKKAFDDREIILC